VLLAKRCCLGRSQYTSICHLQQCSSLLFLVAPNPSQTLILVLPTVFRDVTPGCVMVRYQHFGRPIYQVAWPHTPEDHKRNIYRRGKLQSHTGTECFVLGLTFRNRLDRWCTNPGRQVYIFTVTPNTCGS
jgi:hypothetical protein